MDIQATKPVSGVSVSPESSGGQAQDRVQVQIKAAAPEASRLAPPVRDLRHTLEVVADQMRSFLQNNARDLEFRIDADTQRAVITVRDATGSVIRQIPTEEALRVQRRLNEGSSTFLDLFV
jgi:uncharacterized FlaG/YvyC family protein